MATSLFPGQRSTYEQVKDCYEYARRAGLYDAMDWIERQWPAITSTESELGRNRRLGKEAQNAVLKPAGET